MKDISKGERSTTDQAPSCASVSQPAGTRPALRCGRWSLKLDRGWLLFIGAVVLLILLVLAVGQKYAFDGIITPPKLTVTSFVFILIGGMLAAWAGFPTVVSSAQSPGRQGTL